MNGSGTPPPEIEVTDLDQFVRTLMAWHSAEVERAVQLLAVPEGTAFEIDGKDLVLEGKTLEGFKFGVEMVLMRLATLPFAVQTEEAPAEPASQPITH